MSEDHPYRVHYCPHLGFQPSKEYEIINDMMRAIKESPLKFEYQSPKEFEGTNLHHLFQIFDQQRKELENDIISVIEHFFQWILETQGKISMSRSGSFSGLTQALLDASVKGDSDRSERFIQGASLSPPRYLDPYRKSFPQPGLLFIAIDTLDSDGHPQKLTDPQKQVLQHIFRDYFPVGITTQAITQEIMKEVQGVKHIPETDKITVQYTNGQHIPYFLVMVEPIPITVHINYHCLKESIVPAGADDLVKNAFMREFERVNQIGVDFEPKRYLSTQTPKLEWMTDIEITGHIKGGSHEDFSEWKRCLFYRKFILDQVYVHDKTENK